MHQFQKVGVFLKDTPIDEAVLSFAQHLGQLGATNIHCVLVNGPAEDAAKTKVLADKLDTKVRESFSEDMCKRTTCEVREGHPLEQVLRVARDKGLDLAVIGRKLPSNQLGFGSKVAKIVRKAPCSVMVIPELCQPHFGRILVAVDCSDHSKLAMETAIDLANAADEPRPQLFALTVRQVASRYDLAGVTFEESADAQRQHGQRDLSRFLERIDARGIPVEPMVLLSEEPALAITHAAMAKKMDIVVAGSRGVTSTAAALLGSTSESLLMSCALPILIVKKKGETLHLLEALFAMD